MRLKELIQPEIVQGQSFTKTFIDSMGLTWTAHSRGEFDLTIDIHSPDQGLVAYITLEVNPDEETMSSQDTWVDKNWRRLGLATRMYDWAQELGNTVIASGTLSNQGKKFWKARSGTKA